MYVYEIEVYYPFYENDKIVMGHDGCFDNHQLNIIVQEAFDECIEKYCNKTVLEKGEEACRIEVRTIFEEYLPSQLKNHGFKNIKIKETCSIRNGALFVDGEVGNSVLKNRYKDKALPPCKKCISGESDECIVPNIRKDNNLAISLVVEIKSNDLNEKEESKDDFNISVLKQYFTNSNKSVDDSKIAAAALENILDNDKFEYCYTEHRAKAEGIHERDMFCWFDLDADKERFKKLFKNYGFTFTFDDEEDGFWITGVKE